MPRYEYCALMLNLLQGSVNVVFFKPDGNHIKEPRLDKQPLSSQEREEIVGRFLAEMGMIGWRMCGVINGSIYYFEREMG